VPSIDWFRLFRLFFSRTSTFTRHFVGAIADTISISDSIDETYSIANPATGRPELSSMGFGDCF